MSPRLLSLAVTAALLLPAAVGAEPPPAGIVRPSVPPGTPLLELGRQLFAGNCASCHGARGQGVPAPRPGLGGVHGEGPPLYGVGALAADFYLSTGYMPLAGPRLQPRRSSVLFDGQELTALVAFVASLGHGPPIPRPHPERGTLSDGLRLFTENCAGCHQVAAKGGIVTGARVPPLTDATPVQIAEAVRIGPYVMPRFSPGRLSDRQLDSIIRYVESTRSPRDAGGWGLGDVGPIPEGIVAWLVAGSVLVAVSLLIGRRARQ
jgi:quinol---cytochrome-c reductase cytochrome c subunit